MSTCVLSGCSQPTWNGQPGEYCSKSCRAAALSLTLTCARVGCSGTPWNGQPGQYCSKSCRDVSKPKKFPNRRILYHQTSPEAARQILTTKTMRPGTSGIAGGAIYFAEKAEDTHHKAHHTGVILRVKVGLGRIKTISPHGDTSITYGSLRGEGFDSVCIPRPGGCWAPRLGRNFRFQPQLFTIQ